MRKVFAQTLLVLVVSSVALAQEPSPQGAVSPARTEAEKAIRVSLYEIAVASQTGDAKTFKKYAAQRTLKFYDALIEELFKNQKIKEQMGRAKVTDGDSLIDLTYRGVAQRTSATPRSKIEENARGYAAVRLVFVSDTEAKGDNEAGTPRVVKEADTWKVDMTETLKKGLLASLPLTAESKAKLEKF